MNFIIVNAYLKFSHANQPMVLRSQNNFHADFVILSGLEHCGPARQLGHTKQFK